MIWGTKLHYTARLALNSGSSCLSPLVQGLQVCCAMPSWNWALKMILPTLSTEGVQWVAVEGAGSYQDQVCLSIFWGKVAGLNESLLEGD